MNGAMSIQFLVIAAVIGYGIWSASKASKAKRQQDDGSGGETPIGRHHGENFPFPAPQQPMRGHVVSKTTNRQVDELMIDEGRFGGAGKGGYQPAVATIGLDQEGESGMAVAFAVSDDSEVEIGDNRLGTLQDKKEFVLPDLRTMVISSELLKPKYQEY